MQVQKVDNFFITFFLTVETGFPCYYTNERAIYYPTM